MTKELVDVLHELLTLVEHALGRGPAPDGMPAGGPLHDVRARIAALDPDAPQPAPPAERTLDELQAAAQAGDYQAVQELVRRAGAAPSATGSPATAPGTNAL